MQNLNMPGHLLLHHKFEGKHYIWLCQIDSCGGDIEGSASAATADNSSLESAKSTRHLQVKIASDSCFFAIVNMGHGLEGAREQKPLDKVVVKILEALFQESVQKPSSRKGILEMKEQCKLRLPILLAPNEHVIGSWLSSHLAKQNTAVKASNHTAATQDSDSALSNSKGAKSNFTRKQEKAAVLGKDDKKRSVENTDAAHQLLHSQYLGVVFEVPEDANDTSSTSEIWIVTDLFFHEVNGGRGKSMWCMSTMPAVEAPACKHLTEKNGTASTGDTLNIKIASGSKKSPGLGTYIKFFNTNEKLCMAFDIII